MKGGVVKNFIDPLMNLGFAVSAGVSTYLGTEENVALALAVTLGLAGLIFAINDGVKTIVEALRERR